MKSLFVGLTVFLAIVAIIGCGQAPNPMNNDEEEKVFNFTRGNYSCWAPRLLVFPQDDNINVEKDIPKLAVMVIGGIKILDYYYWIVYQLHPDGEHVVVTMSLVQDGVHWGSRDPADIYAYEPYIQTGEEIEAIKSGAAVIIDVEQLGMPVKIGKLYFPENDKKTGPIRVFFPDGIEGMPVKPSIIQIEIREGYLYFTLLEFQK